jgi:hypothetical protein
MESITRQREKAKMARYNKSKKPEDEAIAREAGVRAQELQYQEAVEYQQATLAERQATLRPVTYVEQTADLSVAADKANYNFNKKTR